MQAHNAWGVTWQGNLPGRAPQGEIGPMSIHTTASRQSTGSRESRQSWTGPGRRASSWLRRTAASRAARVRQALPRLGDQLLALLACAVLAPVLACRALVALAVTGRCLDRMAQVGCQGRRFERLYFSGDHAGRGLASLFNVVRGELALVGPTPRSLADSAPAWRAEVLATRPGLVSPADAQRRVAIDHEGEQSVLRAHLQRESVRGNAGVLVRSLISRALYGEQDFATPERLSFFGVDVQNVTMDAAVDWIDARTREAGPVFVPFVNPHCLNIAHTDDEYRAILQSSPYVLPDGIGLRVGCRMKRQRLVGNVNGTDLFPRLCERLAASGKGLFLLGAAEGVAQTVADNMQARYPGLNVAGARDGFFNDEEESRVIDEINASGAAVLLVAMGVPRQERWIARNLDRLQVPVCMGVGGLFDFYSGNIPRAPLWLREIGLEWTWRLLQEPGRMWRRYLVGNPLFILRVRRELRAAGRGEKQSSAVSGTPLALRWNAARAALRRLGWVRGIGTDRILRRTMDMTGSALLLLALSPLLLLVMAAIRLESPGSVFFSQQRVGRNGREFRFWKFRSMYTDAEARLAQLQDANEMDGGVLFKMRQDPRVTRVGRVIRRFSIDELPQLWNVLVGDMSLVGPRPALPREVAQYTVADRARLEAMPGITCIWQVSGRSEIPFRQQVAMDVEYIHRSSTRTNVELLFKTIPAVLGGRGAY